jgi:aminopeptidase N
VTLKWWDDLWLNESFATYMSYLAMDGAPELKYFTGEWNDFMEEKFSGIDMDQQNTTHPIFSEIKATSDAESVFDGISYGKGASWLK